MRTVCILSSLVTLLYLGSCCEEETHYQKQDKCCKKCVPGKRMLMDDNCEDPRCQDCQDGEYQSGYTSKTKCERQPSCDPNLHFQPQINPSKTSLSKCQCEAGYYCTQDDDCNTCREHKVCKPGQRVVRKGSPVSDTVCEACKNGTFSTHDSADTCEEWAICEYGYDKNAPGSSTSDRICVDGRPTHRAAIGLGVAIFLFILIAGAAMCYAKRHKGWIELPKQAPKIAGLNIRTLHQDADVERAIQPLNKQPEEDTDTSGPVSPTPSNRTENGNVVDQEQGKGPVYPSAESNSYSHL
ncbi:tumor necrosis factor receptor superfamily member 5-like [Sinocyclocheilus grahami]|uniref:Tumor necrosis factor receptor superfamily member 5-like n=1 Tax=Sinocyclocheilus grahami TaxID=75366 RepID=A0A672NRL9_SINGR|nr:PREDICTED: tumor necrosis factor receptor superfamily member 5-like [Sinocyclocheilus grahami]